MTRSILLAALLSLTACQTTKEAVGNYVVEATTQELLNRLDRTLHNHNTSLAQITSILDTNYDGQTSKEEVIAEVRETTKDALLLEANKYIQNTIEANDARILELTAKNQSATKYEIINYILGLVAAYLSKQIYSARQNAKRDSKLAVLEQLLNRDIDGDGTIGPKAEAKK